MGIGVVGMAIMGAVSIGAAYLLRPKMPNAHTKSEGPRLNELSATGSQYGIGIPRVWGTYAVPGNVIWMGEVNEHKNTETTTTRVGGKGSSSKQKHTTTTYTYTVSLAVGLARGRIKHVVKILMDNQVVYDATGGSVDVSVPGLIWRFYPGSEEQLPDSIIAAKEGERTPAFRGLSYVVFDELPITEFANRIPQMQFIIQSDGESYCLAERFEVWGLSPHYAVDFRLGTRYDILGDTLYSQGVHTQKVIRRVFVPSRGTKSSLMKRVLWAGNQAVLIHQYADNKNALDLVDGSTLQTTHTAYAGNALWEPIEASAVAGYTSLINGKHRTIACLGFSPINLGVSSRAGTAILDIETNSTLYSGRVPYGTQGRSRMDPMGTCSYFTVANESVGAAHFIWLHSTGHIDADGDVFYDSRLLLLRNIFVQDYVDVDPLTGSFDGRPEVVYGDFIRNITPLDIDPQGRIPFLISGAIAGWLGPRACVVDDILYDPADGGVLLMACDHAFTIKYSAHGDEVWRFESDDSWQWNVARALSGKTNRGVRLTNKTVAVKGVKAGRRGLYILDTRTGDVLSWCPISAQGGLAYDSHARVVVSNADAIYPDRVTPGEEVSVAEIIDSLSQEVGQPNNDFSLIRDYTVIGYLQAGPETARDMIEPLSELYNFDAVESGGGLRWVRRGGPSLAEYEPTEMVVVDSETGSVIESNRAEELSLPQAVSVTYAEAQTNFEPASFYRQRYVGNEGYDTTRSRNRLSVEVPAAIRADVAKQCADVLLMGAWNGRTSHRFRLPRPALLLDAGDVITVRIPGEFPEDIMVGRAGVGANLAIEIDATSQDSSQYVSTVPAEIGHGFIPQVIVEEMLTRLYLLPVPYLQDLNDMNGTSLLVYYAVGAYRAGWREGTVEHLDSDGGFAAVDAAPTAAPHGVLVSDLPPATQWDVFATNEELELSVSMIHGELDSVSYAELLNGANAIAVLRSEEVAEVIQFRDAELQHDGTYLLTGIVRGQRGTDAWALSGSSPAGTPVVLLDPGTVQVMTLPIEQLNKVEIYRASGANQAAESGDTRAIMARGYEYMPWAPVHLHATLEAGGDITISWQRRTRLRGGLRDGTGVVPLGEELERYEIDVLDGATVLRTIVVTDTTQTVYTLVQRIEDGVDGFIGSLEFAVYQVSALVGRGFPGRVKGPGLDLEVAKQSVVLLHELGAPPVEIAQMSATVLQGVVSSLHVAQQSTTILFDALDSPPYDVAQQSVTALYGRGRPPTEVAQNSITILYEV